MLTKPERPEKYQFQECTDMHNIQNTVTYSTYYDRWMDNNTESESNNIPQNNVDVRDCTIFSEHPVVAGDE